MIKQGEVILIANQDELNKFVEVMRENTDITLNQDELHIDKNYVAFMEDVLYMIEQDKIETGHWTEHIKPRKFSQWMQSVNKRRGK